MLCEITRHMTGIMGPCFLSCASETNLYINMCYYLANNEEVLSLYHSLVNHGMYTLSNFILIFIDKGPINVMVAGQNGCLHSLCYLTWSRLEKVSKF